MSVTKCGFYIDYLSDLIHAKIYLINKVHCSCNKGFYLYIIWSKENEKKGKRR